MQEFVQSHLVSTLNPLHDEVSGIRNAMHDMEAGKVFCVCFFGQVGLIQWEPGIKLISPN